MKEQYEFPPEFIWGASTAAHQIEGNNVASDWWAREHAERTDLSEPSGDAADSYHRYGEDIRMLADAGLGMYRFSIEWARIEPAEGCFSKAQLLHYRQMIDACHENGVEPMVTLNHMTLPLWLATKGGWLNADAVDYFARYVRYVMPILHDVTWVCTINEPNMVALTRGGTEGSDFVAASLPAPAPPRSSKRTGKPGKYCPRTRVSSPGGPSPARRSTPCPDANGRWRNTSTRARTTSPRPRPGMTSLGCRPI